MAWAAAAAAADDLNTISSSPTWLKLGRWDRSPAQSRSNVVNQDFFLAPDGTRNPYSELTATLTELRGPLGPAPNDHVLCRYPARALFLDQRLDLGLPDPFKACPDLKKWSGGGRVSGVSVIFVAGYFANPGSAFGHLLLRMHTDSDATDAAEVLDKAINYGARQSENDAIPVYIVRGLTGSYRSTYSSLEFYHHDERFRTEQLRDLWEYRLDLDEDNTRLLTAHIWEMTRAQNKYYFLRQNCGFRVAELLELVVDRDLIPDTKMWMAPVDVVEGLAREVDGQSAVVSVTRLPSRETAFRDGYALLSSDERQFVDQAAADTRRPQDLAKDIGIADPREAYNVLLDFLALQPADDASTEKQRQVLAARLALPPSDQAEPQQPLSPTDGQPSSVVEMGLVSNEETGEGISFRVRPAYFDFLTRTGGTSPYAELSMGDLTLLAREGTVHLKRLDAVRVTSLGLAGDGAPNRDGRAFRTRFGAETRELACDSCLVAFGEAALGEAIEIAPGLAVYGLLGGRLEAGDTINDTVSGLALAGLVGPGKTVGLTVEAGFQQGFSDTDVTRPLVRGELRFRRDRRSDGGITLAHDGTTEIGVVFRRYW